MGRPTRGKTARHRLRRVDTFLLLYDPSLLRREDGPYAGAFFVDLGYGAEPVTTLESAQRLRQANPALPVLGVEIDPERVAAAQPHADGLTHFRLGGFNLPLQARPDGVPETVRLIRAFNVLRQYEEEDVAQAHTRLGSQLLPGGLLVEGTAEPYGRLWVANLLRKPAAGDAWAPLDAEGLLFSTNFRLPFHPADFQAVLPKSYIHRMLPGESIHRFMETWKQATRETVSWSSWGQRQWFAAAAELTAQRGYDILLRRKFLARGFLLLYSLEPC